MALNKRLRRRILRSTQALLLWWQLTTTTTSQGYRYKLKNSLRAQPPLSAFRIALHSPVLLDRQCRLGRSEGTSGVANTARLHRRRCKIILSPAPGCSEPLAARLIVGFQMGEEQSRIVLSGRSQVQGSNLEFPPLRNNGGGERKVRNYLHRLWISPLFSLCSRDFQGNAPFSKFSGPHWSSVFRVLTFTGESD